MNIIHYYDACRHISYYDQALNGKGVMLILLSMKKKLKFKLYDHVFVVTVIHMNIIT